MSLMEPPQYDEARERRRRRRIIQFIVVALILAWVGYHLRHYPERRVAHKFFTALQEKDVERAYALWMQDPDWKQHATKYANYSFSDFSRDWGPAGDWGIIKSHRIDCSYSTGGGVLVQVTVNDRAERAYLWVEKSDKTLHFSPSEIECGNWWGWLTE